MATILVVEDNEMNMRLFVDLLKSRGHDVLPCNQAVEVVDIILEQHPDLVLMDIQLPMISGLDLTQLIRHHKKIKNTPVIAVSAFAMEDDKKRILNAGCDDYISKPIEIDSFFKTVDKWLSMGNNLSKNGKRAGA